MPRAPLSILAAALLLASCGGGPGRASDTTFPGGVNPKYADFCLLAHELDALSKGTHGNDPEAMSDPEAMRKAWATIIESSARLVAAAPGAIAFDLAEMLGAMRKMDKIYASFGYSLAEMKGAPGIAPELDKIANGEKVTAASGRFRAFMARNCGE